MDNVILLFLVAVAIAVVLNVTFKRFEIPTIIGYVLTGVAISQIFSLKGSEDLVHIAEFGVVFLMFTIGLEFSVKHLWSMKKEVFVNGGLQVLLSGFAYMIIAKHLFYLDTKAAIVISFALSFSSTAIVLKILNDSGDIQTVYGRRALGILLFQDIAVIPLFIMIKLFTSSDSSLSHLLVHTSINALIVLVLLFIIGKYLLNRALFAIVKTGSHETFIASILFLVMGASYLANYFEFSYSLGAFLAGMMIAETKFKYQVEADLVPFRDLLLGLFFITVGMQVNFSVVAKFWHLIVTLVLGIMFIKTLIIYLIMRVNKNRRVSFKTAIAISQVGEFALAIFELSRASGLLSTNISQILIVVTIVSMFITPFILRNIKNIVDTVITLTNEEEFKIESASVSDHLIVIGYGKLGEEIVKKLKNYDLNYIIIEHDITRVRLGRERGEPIIFGNAAHKNMLQHAKVSTCKAVIVAISNNKKALELICENISSLSSEIHAVIKVSDDEEKELIKPLFDIDNILKEPKIMAKALVKRALKL